MTTTERPVEEVIGWPPCLQCGGSGWLPRPDGWDQDAHLESGTCACHDSWDQCPCADDGHSPGCGCCPGGTGLCGRLPCPHRRAEVDDLAAWLVDVASQYTGLFELWYDAGFWGVELGPHGTITAPTIRDALVAAVRKVADAPPSV